MLQVAFWLSIVSLFLVVLRVPRQRWVRVVSMILVAACGVVAILCVIDSAPAALGVVTGLTLTFRLSGVLLAWLGTAAAAASAGLQLSGD